MSLTILQRIGLLCVFLLTACGGGGGGGGGGSGVTVNTSAINFSAERYGNTPTTQNYTVSWDNPSVAGVIVGVPPGESVPSWISVSLSGSSSPLNLSVGVNTTDLPAGTYTMTMRVVSGDASANLINLVDIPVRYTVTDSLSSRTTYLSYIYIQGLPTLPAAQNISLTGPNVSWHATADQSWVKLSSTTGVTPSSLSVGVDTTGLTPGNHTAVLTFTNDNDASDTHVINLALQVVAPYIQLSRNSHNAYAINGTPIASQNIAFSLSNQYSGPWTITTSVPWLTVNSTSWASPDTVTVGINPAASNLPSGTHFGQVTFSTSYLGQNIETTVPVTLRLTRPQLTVNSASLNFQGGPASDFSAADVGFSINTGTANHPWQIELLMDSGSGWLNSSASSGNVSQTQQSASISINPAGQSGSRYTGTVKITVTVNGDTLTHSIPVELVLEPHRLFVADNGVALLSTSGMSKLNHTVKVSDNRQLTVPWTASSDQSWLSVTASGNTGDDLQLSADPSSLAAETIHYANVTINSTAPTVTNSGKEVIRVGLYVTNSTPAAQVTATVSAKSYNEVTGLMADPVRPYVYVTHSGTDIEVYNIYSGALVHTISAAGTDLRNMTISTNGDTLYALDYTQNSIVTVDLTASTPVANPAWTDTAWSNCACNNPYYYAALQYTRVNGKAVLIGGARDIIDASTGTRLYPSDAISFIGQAVVTDITPDGSVMFSANTNSAGHTVRRHSLKYSEINDTFTLTQTHSTSKSGYNRGMSTSPSGDRVYRACWYDTSDMEIYNGSNMASITTIPSGTNGGALYGPDGLIYCARYYSDTTSGDVWSMNPADNSIVKNYNVTGEVATRMFTISGDGKRLITRSNNQATLTTTSIE